MSNKRLRELADMHGQCSLATRAWAADEIQRLIADRDAWKAAHDTAVSSAYRKRCELQAYIGKLEAFEKSRRKYRNALRELEKDDE